jgi:hypothetical protein
LLLLVGAVALIVLASIALFAAGMRARDGGCAAWFLRGRDWIMRMVVVIAALAILAATIAAILATLGRRG